MKGPYPCEAVGTPWRYRRNSIQLTEKYQSDENFLRKLSQKPRAGNASRATRYLPEETV